MAFFGDATALAGFGKIPIVKQIEAEVLKTLGSKNMKSS